MKTIKLLRFAAALLACFTAGVFAVQWQPKDQGRELQRLGESVGYTAPLYRQYRDGDYAQAKSALLEVARHLEESDAESGRRGVGHYGADAMLAYARLARLEEKHGRGRGAEFMREAVARCERLRRRGGEGGGWRYGCDEPTLRGMVERLDAEIK